LSNDIHNELNPERLWRVAQFSSLAHQRYQATTKHPEIIFPTGVNRAIRNNQTATLLDVWPRRLYLTTVALGTP
jgi:hypothetical protein